MKCDSCGGAMKPLFSSWFCPRDCDRIPKAVDREDTHPLCPACGSVFTMYNQHPSYDIATGKTKTHTTYYCRCGHQHTTTRFQAQSLEDYLDLLGVP